MPKYIIKDIQMEGYERFATVQHLKTDTVLTVHFCDYDEYLENGKQSKKGWKDKGLAGTLSIGLIVNSKLVNAELTHCQPIKNSSYVEAVVEIADVAANDSAYAYSSILDEPILLEFETGMNYEVGNVIFITGSIEIKMIKELKAMR